MNSNRTMATTLLLHLSPKPPQASAPSFPFPFPLISFSKPRFLPLHPIKKAYPITKMLSSNKSGNGSYSNTPPLPETECPVPHEQQPINEYQSLSTSFPFSWASGDLVEYCSRLFVTGASFALFVGLPVAWFGSVGPKSEPMRLVLAAVSSGILVVTVAVLRMYLGWAYVGNRLLSATVECKLLCVLCYSVMRNVCSFLVKQNFSFDGLLMGFLLFMACR